MNKSSDFCKEQKTEKKEKLKRSYDMFFILRRKYYLVILISLLFLTTYKLLPPVLTEYQEGYGIVISRSVRAFQSKIRELRHLFGSPTIPQVRGLSKGDRTGWLLQNGYCLDAGKGEEGSVVTTTDCDKQLSQYWTLTSDRLMRSFSNMCLTSSSSGRPVVLEKCSKPSFGQRWHMNHRDSTIRSYIGTAICLDSANKDKSRDAVVESCDNKRASTQQWSLLST
ncbi:uncharacterized protein LOC5520760 [Nematostella vectensis]|nr:uncharacterized protein LOC5520760 [Nematostella vectensis]